MYALIVALNAHPDKIEELKTAMQAEVIPLLREQPGFIEVNLLRSEDPERPEHILALSFWQSKEDSDRYSREQYAKVLKMLGPWLRAEPRVHAFNVEISSERKVAAGRAA